MPHQWMEGNLPVSSTCVICKKTCGSVLRLQDWRCLWCKNFFFVGIKCLTSKFHDIIQHTSSSDTSGQLAVSYLDTLCKSCHVLFFDNGTSEMFYCETTGTLSSIGIQGYVSSMSLLEVP